MNNSQNSNSSTMREMLAYALRMLRLHAGLSQEEAAQAAGVDVSLIVDAENAIWTDALRVNELGEICRVYGMDLLKLMCWLQYELYCASHPGSDPLSEDGSLSSLLFFG